MPSWPAITDPLLAERLAMDDDAFREYMLGLTGAVGRRGHTPESYAHALAYPWERPSRSFLLTGGDVMLLEELEPAERDRVLAAFSGDGGTRFPLLAFGSNAAPERLRVKLGHFDPPDRDILVLAGDLHDFDVGASAHPTLYGSMPATLFPSPGTAVRAAILWVTPAQFVQFTWSEITYRLGRLEGIRFVADELGTQATSVLAYSSRFGTFCPEGDGTPAALAAIPAVRRTALALTQEQILDAAARRVLGPNASAETLVRRMFEDGDGLVREVGPQLVAAGDPFASDRWVPYPAPGVADAVAPGASAPG